MPTFHHIILLTSIWTCKMPHNTHISKTIGQRSILMTTLTMNLFSTSVIDPKPFSQSEERLELLDHVYA